MLLSWSSLLSILGMTLSFFMIIIVLNRPCLKKSNYYLAGLLFSLTLSQCYEILYTTKLYTFLPFLIKIYIPPQFLIGPFLFFYISAITDKSFIFLCYRLIHFIPFLISLIYLTPFFLLSSNKKIQFVETSIISQIPTSLEEFIIWGLLQLSLLYYCILSLKKIVLYKKKIKEFHSNISDASIMWSQYFLISITSFIPFFIIIDFFMIFGYPLVFFNHLISGSMNLTILGVSIWAIIKIEHITIPFNNEVVKLSRTTLKIDQTSLENMFEDVSKKVKVNEYFLQPELALPELADYMKINRTELSRIINQGGGLSYYDFINKFRVMKAQSMLSSNDYKHQSILNIAFSCGFNSKSTFHSAFQKWIGVTPTEVRKCVK